MLSLPPKLYIANFDFLIAEICNQAEIFTIFYCLQKRIKVVSYAEMSLLVGKIAAINYFNGKSINLLNLKTNS